MITVNNINGKPESVPEIKIFGTHSDENNFYFFETAIEVEEYKTVIATKYNLAYGITNAPLKSLHTQLEKNEIDFLKYRDQIKLLVLPDFSILSVQEKKTLVQSYIYPVSFTQNDIDILFTIAEQKKNWSNIIDKTTAARSARVTAAKKSVSFLANTTDSRKIYNDTKPFINDYIFAAASELILFFQNGEDLNIGVDFALNGYKSKIYYSSVIEIEVLDILINGNY